ncbi:MAG: 3-dehydroquinate synthase [Planctomycetota bacterium]|jgi:3-dehydroquinate synthase
MADLTVRLGERRYDIRVAWGSLEEGLARFVASRIPPGRTALLSDENVSPLYGDVVQRSLEEADRAVHRATVPAGERSKSFATLETVLGDLLEGGLDRSSSLVALGGGVVGDLGGFSAATFMRGIPFLMVPTSLLAQVDSSVGGKVAVNHPRAKNLVGAFHQPAGVLVDPATLRTLPDGEFTSGMAEAVKTAIILDESLFSWIEDHAEGIRSKAPDDLVTLIHRCLRIKADVVAADERERTGHRSLLNLGHTLGHALETVRGPGFLRHGEAVAVGTVFASRLAVRTAEFPAADAARVEALLAAFGLPTRMPTGTDPRALLLRMREDKKNRGEAMRMVLPRRIGEAEIREDVDEASILRGLDELSV